MGGFGSGSRWLRPSRKTTVEECLCLDACRWAREGILRYGMHEFGAWSWTYADGRKCSINYEANVTDQSSTFVRLSYSVTLRAAPHPVSLDYSVKLTTTRPPFGGVRWWFLCPLNCARRVVKLYLPPGTRYFGCRQCHQLTYTSCQESHKYDAMYGMLARNMGCSAGDVKAALAEGEKNRRR